MGVEGKTGFGGVAKVAKGVDVEVGKDFEDEFVGDKRHRAEVVEVEKFEFWGIGGFLAQASYILGRSTKIQVPSRMGKQRQLKVSS